MDPRSDSPTALTYSQLLPSPVSAGQTRQRRCRPGPRRGGCRTSSSVASATDTRGPGPSSDRNPPFRRAPRQWRGPRARHLIGLGHAPRGSRAHKATASTVGAPRRPTHSTGPRQVPTRSSRPRTSRCQHRLHTSEDHRHWVPLPVPIPRVGYLGEHLVIGMRVAAAPNDDGMAACDPSRGCGRTRIVTPSLKLLWSERPY